MIQIYHQDKDTVRIRVRTQVPGMYDCIPSYLATRYQVLYMIVGTRGFSESTRSC